MKYIFILLSLIFCSSLAQPANACHVDKSEWNLTGFENPESAYYDAATDTIYISNVSGDPSTKDGKGFISTLSPDGKIKELHWLDGFNAPKGMRVYQGHLYVTDIDRVVKIDIAAKKISKTFVIPKAVFLNDLTLDTKGTVYVTDTFGNAIYSISPKGKTEVLFSGAETEGPNGILVEGDHLFVATWGKNTKPDFSTDAPGKLVVYNLKTKKLKAITPNPIGHNDGLEVDQHGHWIVSDWMNGKIFHVSPKGDVRDLISLKSGTADIGFVPKGNLVIVPQMKENNVTAYRIK